MATISDGTDMPLAAGMKVILVNTELAERLDQTTGTRVSVTDRMREIMGNGGTIVTITELRGTNKGKNCKHAYFTIKEDNNRWCWASCMIAPTLLKEDEDGNYW
jgi:hypothetical protein